MTTPVISAHAMVRFLERGLGMDLTPQRIAVFSRGSFGDPAIVHEVRVTHPGLVEQIEKEIGPKVSAGVDNGAVSVVLGGLTFCLIGCTVVTVIEGRVDPRILKRADGTRLNRQPRIAA